jgi:hypothetical protein
VDLTIATVATVQDSVELAIPALWIPTHTFLELKPASSILTLPDQESNFLDQSTVSLTTLVLLIPTLTYLEPNYQVHTDHTIDHKK